MVVNIYDTANEMERQMETQEFQALKEAFAELKRMRMHLVLSKIPRKQMQAQQSKCKAFS